MAHLVQVNYLLVYLQICVILRYVIMKESCKIVHGLFQIYFSRCRNDLNGKGTSLIFKETWFRVQSPKDKNQKYLYFNEK